MSDVPAGGRTGSALLRIEVRLYADEVDRIIAALKAQREDDPDTPDDTLERMETAKRVMWSKGYREEFWGERRRRNEILYGGPAPRRY